MFVALDDFANANWWYVPLVFSVLIIGTTAAFARLAEIHPLGCVFAAINPLSLALFFCIAMAPLHTLLIFGAFLALVLIAVWCRPISDGEED